MISIHQQIKCVEREIVKRRSFYPRWVNEGKMSQDAANREIAAMEAVLVSLKGLAPREATLYDEHG